MASNCRCESRLCDQKESALLKHEVAFVLGQLEHTGAVDALCDAVSREHEHSMVRFCLHLMASDGL